MRPRTVDARIAAEPIRVIDSHTAGEPTRVVVSGVPDLGEGDLKTRLAAMRRAADWVRTSLVLEPRGAPWMVGAALLPPADPACAAAVLFFNNAGYLGMCGHGTMGVVETLRWLGRIGPGTHRIETPVGEVRAHLAEDGEISIENVPCRRARRAVEARLADGTRITGDVAWGGNWFFLADSPLPLKGENIPALTALSAAIMAALARSGVTGDDGAPVDHIELFGPPSDPARFDARNFVLCPGGLYDRSPCGTGLCAKLACLAAEGALPPGKVWRQESIIGSSFTGQYRMAAEGVVPTMTGRAYVNADVTLVMDPRDEFRFGMQP